MKRISKAVIKSLVRNLKDKGELSEYGTQYRKTKFNQRFTDLCAV